MNKLKKLLKNNITIIVILVTLITVFFIFKTLDKSTNQKEVFNYRTYTKAYWINETHMMDFLVTIENGYVVSVDALGFPVRINEV